MSRWRRAALCTLLVGMVLPLFPEHAGAGSAAIAQAEELPPLRILAAGDSFAAGEGLGGIQRGEEACQRALGQQAEGDTEPSKAWPVLMKETHEGKHGTVYQEWNVATFWFTACTGNTSLNFAREPTAKGMTQLAEAQADAGTDPWDVVTLSFGGNDIGFPGIVQDCIGMDGDLLEAGSLVPGVFGAKLTSGTFAGCSMTEDQMKSRIDQGWTDGDGVAWPPLATGLGKVYDEAAAVTRSGGLVVVTGYPQLIEDPALWPNANKVVNRCERVSEGDTRALRGAAGHLNEVIGQQVAAARDRHPGLTWVFVDVTPSFEPSEGVRHSLCAEENWINGFSFLGGLTDADLRALDDDGLRNQIYASFKRSYHPTQNGQWAYSRAVVDAIRQSGWIPHRSACPDGAVCQEQRGDLDADGRTDLVAFYRIGTPDAPDFEEGIRVVLATGADRRLPYDEVNPGGYGSGLVGVAALDDLPGDEIMATFLMGTHTLWQWIYRWRDGNLERVLDPATDEPIRLAEDGHHVSPAGITCADTNADGTNELIQYGGVPVDGWAEPWVGDMYKHVWEWHGGELVGPVETKSPLTTEIAGLTAYTGFHCAGLPGQVTPLAN